ncbi:MAG: 30S ribosomal protein S16 [Acidobacteriaceae bacterium]
MLIIRLQRTGTKNKPQFRIVLAEAARSASKKFKEVLGSYHPRSKNFAIKDAERLKYWLSLNVQISPTVKNLFIEKKLIDGKKTKAWAPKKKKKEAEAQPAEAPKA